MLLVEPRRLQETLGDSEKLALPIEVTRERNAEGLAIRAEACGYRHHRLIVVGVPQLVWPKQAQTIHCV